MQHVSLDVSVDHPQVSIEQSAQSIFGSVIGLELCSRGSNLHLDNHI